MAAIVYRRGPSSFQPRLESLERRDLLSTYIIKDLGAAPYGAGATGIGGRGRVVGFGHESTGKLQGEVWLRTGDVALSWGLPSAINDHGVVVGNYLLPSGVELCQDSNSCGFLWELGIGDLKPTGIVSWAVNHDDVVAGDYYPPLGGGPHAATSLDGAVKDLGTLIDGGWSTARGINGVGWVTGYASVSPSDVRAFLYDGSSMQDLGTLGGTDSWGHAISNTGYVAGESTIGTGGTRHAFRYIGGAMTDLGALPDFPNSSALSVNDGGTVVGAAWNDTEYHALVYSGGVLNDLNDLVPPSSGFTIQSAAGISDKGLIAATGLGSDNLEHALMLLPQASAPAPRWEFLAAMAQAAKKYAET
jgi:probable HAF family extracellular repeat protein